MARFETGEDGKVFIKSGSPTDEVSTVSDPINVFIISMLKLTWNIVKWSFYIGLPVLAIYGLFSLSPMTIIIVLLVILILK